MGFLGFGNKKKNAQEELELHPQEALRKQWQSDTPFLCESYLSYDHGCKRQIDGRLTSSLGLSNMDDLIQMKAPNFYKKFNTLTANVHIMGNYLLNDIDDKLKTNDDYQRLLGKYEELQKRCEEQEALIHKLVSQNREAGDEISYRATPSPLSR